MAMSRIEIFDKLIDISKMVLGEEKVESTNVLESSRLVEDLGLTSVGLLYMVIVVEETFSIRFDDVSFGDFKTIKDVIDYIIEKLPPVIERLRSMSPLYDAVKNERK